MRTFVLISMLVSSAAFADVIAGVRASVPKLDKMKRGKLATSIRPALESLGAKALPDLLAAANEPADPSWTDSAKLAWRVSVLEALGTLQDAQARPVFEKALADESAPFLVQRAAAEGLAKLGDLATLERLIERDAVVAGIGSLRSPQTVRVLAAELDKKPSEARAKLIVKALGEVANAWAWQTMPNREAEQTTRNAAAAALVKAFVGSGGEVRQAASNALVVVDAPATPALIAQARAQGVALVELEGLQQRLVKSPMR